MNGRAGASCEHRRISNARRRGSAYVLVLVTAAIVSVIGLSGVTLSRIELRRQNSARDLDLARAAARAGVQFGYAKVRAETDWSRLRSGSDDWASAVSIGSSGANFSLERIAWDDSDPVNPQLTLEATGGMGDAVVRYRVVIIRGAYLLSGGYEQTVR